MKKFLKLVPGQEKKSDKEFEFKHFQNGDETSRSHSPKLEMEKPRHLNHYTKCPITSNGRPEFEKLMKPNLVVKPFSPNTERRNPKTDLMTNKYEKEFYSLLIDQLQKYNGNFNIPFTLDALSKKNLKKLDQKLNISKSDKAYLKWMTLVKIFLTSKLEWYLPILQLLPDSFHKVKIHLSNALMTSHVEEFWKSIEESTDAVFTEIIVKEGKQLFTKETMPTKTGELIHSALMFLGTIWHYFEQRRYTSLLDDEMDSIARVHMETLFSKLETMLAVLAKKMLWEIVSGTDLENLKIGIPKLNKELMDNLVYWKNNLQNYTLKLDMYELIYSVWDYEIAEAVKVVIEDSKKDTKPMQFNGKYPILSQDYDCTRDISLFELFKSLRSFSTLTDKTGLPNFVHVKGSMFSWYRDIVPQLIDIACYRAIQRIEKAINLDSLMPVSNNSKVSCSAVHTTEIFLSMEKHWHELNWPNPEEAYSFAILTLKNFDRCIQFYVDRIYIRVEELEVDDFHNFEISDQFCMALNNVEYVTLKVESIVESLCISKVLEKLFSQNRCETDGAANSDKIWKHSTAVEQCKHTPPNIVQNWTDYIQRRTSCNLIQTCHKQIEPLICMYVETATSSTQSERDSNRLICHLNGILQRMTTQLTSSEYARAFPTIAVRIMESFLEFAQRNLKGKKSKEFFVQLEFMLAKLCELFLSKGIEDLDIKKHDEIYQMKKMIQLYKSSTIELICGYLERRYKQQILADQSNHHEGKITILTHYNKSNKILNVKLLNASLLNTGDVTSYIKFQIYIKSNEEWMKTKQIYCSKVKKRTQYPVFEQTFEIKISEKDLEAEGGFLHFYVKHGYVGWWTFVGESIFPLNSIKVTDTGETNELSQIKLPITKPNDEESHTHILNILEEQKDNVGLKFARTQRTRIVSVP